VKYNFDNMAMKNIIFDPQESQIFVEIIFTFFQIIRVL